MARNSSASKLHQRIYAVVRRIPRGTVLTYGEVARRAGLSNAARLAGYAMAVAPDGLPWQRVVGKSRRRYGRVTIRDSLQAELQRELLEAEGVRFTELGEIDLERFGA